MAKISEALAIAIQHHQAGRLAAAEQLYRQILQADANHADALHLLGVLAHQTGKHEAAVQQIERAIKLKGDAADFHNNLGAVLKEQGKVERAIASFRRAVELNPALAGARNNLGDALKEQGKLEEAVACFRRALDLNPSLVQSHIHLGNALRAQGRLGEAEGCFRKALELGPDSVEAHNNLGLLYKDLGRPEEAVACYRRALQVNPKLAQVHNNLGVACMDEGKLDEAVACFSRALALNAGLAGAHDNLANACKDLGKLDEAIASFHRALALDPSLAGAHVDLGNAYKDQGKLDEAASCYRRALALGWVKADSNLVYLQLFQPGVDSPQIYREHRRWHEAHAAPLAKLVRPHPNDRSPERRLRIGYVSPNLRDHVVGRNLLPLFREHDHRQIEVFCYSDALRPDELTRRFQGFADAWRETARLTDERLAALIREDRIDILVDLTLHMAHHRLRVLARRPAPVQVTFAGYPGTTGLSTVDYRLTDPYLDPPGRNDECYSEESIRLPHSFWCYEPLEREPEAGPLPALEREGVTFGCLNNFCKINPPTLEIWARILCAVKHSRLTLLTQEGAHRGHTLELLERDGVSRDRVTFLVPRPRPDYLRYYHGIDIGLDTVPYNGHTTSLDSLWMGVPVVTLVGPTVVGRAGLSQLMNLGLPELIASTEERYLQIAIELAQDLPRLGRLRGGLRERMEASPLMDAPRFAGGVEAAYREVWRRWCGSSHL